MKTIYFILTFFVSILIIAIYSVIIGVINVIKTKKWKKNKATIIEADYNYLSDADYNLNIKYEYKVDNNKYIGSNLNQNLAHRFYSKKECEEILLFIKKGEEKDIYYDPLNCNDSFLQIDSKKRIFIPQIIGIIVLIFLIIKLLLKIF